MESRIESEGVQTDDLATSVFEAIETIIWKPAIVSIVRTFKMIQTIIWKPGLRDIARFTKSVNFTFLITISNLSSAKLQFSLAGNKNKTLEIS